MSGRLCVFKKIVIFLHKKPGSTYLIVLHANRLKNN